MGRAEMRGQKQSRRSIDMSASIRLHSEEKVQLKPVLARPIPDRYGSAAGAGVADRCVLPMLGESRKSGVAICAGGVHWRPEHDKANFRNFLLRNELRNYYYGWLPKRNR